MQFNIGNAGRPRPLTLTLPDPSRVLPSLTTYMILTPYTNQSPGCPSPILGLAVNLSPMVTRA